MNDLKTASYECMYHRQTKMSGRVMAAVIYALIRFGEVIDYWFPVKT